MRLIIVLLLIPTILKSQEFIVESNSNLSIGSQVVFYSGQNLQLNGQLNNEGELVINGDLNVRQEGQIGDLTLIGGDQVITGDSLVIGTMKVNNGGEASLATSYFEVTESLEVSGVLKMDQEDGFIFTGNSFGDGLGYLEGELKAKSNNGSILFPLGITGSANYITVNGLEDGAILTASISEINDLSESLPPDASGVATKAQWELKSENGEGAYLLEVNYNDFDFQNLSNFTSIRSDVYRPVIFTRSKTDTSFVRIPSTFNGLSGFETSGSLTADSTVFISSDPVQVNLGLVPLQTAPTLYVPNSFSPFAEFAENRLFRAFFTGADVSRIDVRIFNNFQDEIFSYRIDGENLSMEDSSWDGTGPTGQVVEDGVYYYQIQIIAENENYSSSGTVLLVK